MSVRAYLNWGRWVADCPNPTCWNARKLEPGQEVFYCCDPWDDTIGCKTVDSVVWPEDPEAIEAAVAGLPRSGQSWQPEAEE